MRYQPQGRLRLNRANPLCKGLEFLYVAGSPVNVTGKSSPGQFAGSAKRVGGSLVLSGLANNGMVLGNGGLLGGLQNSSVVALASVAANVDAKALYCERSPGGGDIYKLETQGYGPQFTYRNDAGTLLQLGTGNAGIADGVPRLFFLTKSGTAHTVGMFSLDSAVPRQASNTFGSSSTSFTDSTVVRTIGYDTGDSSQAWAGTVDFLAGWSRALTGAQIESLRQNPWQLFEASEEDDFLTAILGATYTLATSVGSFALTALSARLVAARRIVGAAGSLLLSGSGAGLLANRRLPAVAASYVLAGSAVRLTAARRLPADTGAVQLAGSAAGLKAARVLPSAAGAIALSGTAANLLAARKLTAQPAEFALTGNTATFVYTPAQGGQGPTYTLLGGSGAFLLSATAARLLLARRLVAAVGAFSAAGTAASLVVARRLPAAPGAFAVTASAASLRAARRLPGAAGSVALSVSAVTFVYTPVDKPGGPTYTLTAVGGALVVTVASAGLRASRRLVAGAGQVTLTGALANLVYSQQIVYARAPAGSGYAPQASESQRRPTSAVAARPAAQQRNKR